ncbi:MAG: hypothetical protein ACOYB2_11125 [Limnohabitans sp.]
MDVRTLDKPGLMALRDTWERKFDETWDQPAAHEAARRSLGVVEDELARRVKRVEGPHCQQCGGRIGIDSGSWEGYTSCCNERVVSTCEPGGDCSHGMYD